MPHRRDILSEERNVADVLSDVLTSVPGFLQQGADVRNRNLLLNLEQITGAQERKAKSKHQKFMEEIAAGTLMQRQQAAEGRLAEEQRQFDIEQTAADEPLSSQGKQIQDLMTRFGLTREQAIDRVFKITPTKAPPTIEATRGKAVSELVKPGEPLPTQGALDSLTQFIQSGQFPAAPPEEPSGIGEFFKSLFRPQQPIGFEGAPAETTRVDTGLTADEQKELELLRKKHGR